MSAAIKPQNFEETIVWYFITCTYIFYFMGVLFIVYPLMGWLMVGYVILKLWHQTDETPPEERIRVPWVVWVWIFSMGVLLIALIIGHINFELGTKQLLKSCFDTFPRQWALFAVFPLLGCLRVRPQIIYRAACILCLQSLIYVIAGHIGNLVHAPGILYTPPFGKFNGGNMSTQVLLYSNAGEFRLTLFTPFSPALGVVGNIYFWLSCYEPNKKWRWIGIIGAVAMIWFSASRTGRICLFTLPLAIWVLAYIRRPLVQLAVGAVSLIGGISSYQVLNWLKDYETTVKDERSGSTKYRIILRRVALRRWWEEAPVWGHGIADTGNAFVRGKGIGSHGTWHGILFLHGIVGFLALVVPIVCSAIDLLIKMQYSKVAQVGLGILGTLVIYGFSENIEGQAYLFWPGLVCLGVAFREKLPVISPSYESEFA